MHHKNLKKGNNSNAGSPLACAIGAKWRKKNGFGARFSQMAQSKKNYEKLSDDENVEILREKNDPLLFQNVLVFLL